MAVRENYRSVRVVKNDHPLYNIFEGVVIYIYENNSVDERFYFLDDEEYSSRKEAKPFSIIDRKYTMEMIKPEILSENIFEL